MPSPDAGSNSQALFKAFIMIVVSEIGDKTFLIAAIMASRHARMTVFAGAFASLVVMSILSAALGKVILGLVPKVVTLWAAALLFLVFGLKMLQEALAMSSGHLQDEMREVEEELEEDASLHDPSNARGTSIPLEAAEEGRVGRPLESGRSLASPSSPSAARFGTGSGRSASPKGKGRPVISFPLSGGSGGVGPVESTGNWLSAARETVRRSLQVMTSPVFAQAFVLTFLGEWGDRSQITTIAMGGAHSIPVIAFGTILGHGLCTCGAVLGGRYLSTKISVKHISLIGSFAFLVFAVLYAVEAHATPWGAMVDDGIEW
ncbi:GCR1-dependent translation factor 1 [Cryptotrichosporon argae]